MIKQRANFLIEIGKKKKKSDDEGDSKKYLFEFQDVFLEKKIANFWQGSIGQAWKQITFLVCKTCFY